ncbi:RNA-binding RNA processing protein rpp1 [Cryptotrichosporon argae]
MYYDLFVPFPSPDAPEPKKKKDKGKGKAAAAPAPAPPEDATRDCWAGLAQSEREAVALRVALEGHLGYDVVAFTVASDATSAVVPCPFGDVPYPAMDPRFASAAGSGSGAGGSARGSRDEGRKLVQVTRLHVRLDETKVHPFTASNTAALAKYDLLSVLVSSDKTFQLACTDLSMPGPNQLSIITLPLHERPYHFRLNRKQVRQAQRNGAVFELLYAAALFPPPATGADTARRFRQNFMSNARELVRLTGGRGIIFSSGPSGSTDGLRGPADVVNFATMLGIPANLAKDAVSLTPKLVVLRAQARRTYKGVFATPTVVFPNAEQAPMDVDVDVDGDGDAASKDDKKREATELPREGKKVRV